MKKITNTLVLLLILISSFIAQVDNVDATKTNGIFIEKGMESVSQSKVLVTPDSTLSSLELVETFEDSGSIELDFKLPFETRLQPLEISETIFYDQEIICDEYNMYDHNPLTGFVDDLGYCVPGLVTNAVWFTKSPQYVYGTAVPYSPGMMRATAVWRRMNDVAYNYTSEYLGGVATPSPADIGETVWLRREGYEWEGPYLVVDCSRRADMGTHIAINQQVVEIDFDTARRWEMAYYTADWWVIDIAIEYPVEVYYGIEKPPENIREVREPIFFAEYWINNVAEYQREEIEPTPHILEFGLNPVWDLHDGSDPTCFTTACSQE